MHNNRGTVRGHLLILLMLLSDALMALRVVQHAQANSRSRSASIDEILAAAVTASAFLLCGAKTIM
ncbi:MAG: hypothetical protein ABGX40_03740 [Methylococcales bacterium]